MASANRGVDLMTEVRNEQVDGARNYGVLFGGGEGNARSFGYEVKSSSQSTDLIAKGIVRVTGRGKEGFEQTEARFKASIASSAHRSERKAVPRAISGQHMIVATFATDDTMATEIIINYGASIPSAEGPRGKLSARELNSKAKNIITCFNARLGTEMSSDVVALQVVRTLGLMAIMKEARVSAGGNAKWISRPVNPSGCYPHNQILNEYEAKCAEISGGSHIVIELHNDELRYIPMLIMLLGTSPANLKVNFGVSHGNPRTPHLCGLSLPTFSYSFVVKDKYGDFGANETSDCAIAGLMAGNFSENKVAEVEYKAPETGMINYAMEIIGRTLRSADQLEAATLVICIESFAEQWGCQTVKVGSQAEACARSGLHTKGDFYIPKGKFDASFGSIMASDSEESMGAMRSARDIVKIMSNVSNMRNYCVPALFSIQGGLRACGASVELIYPMVPWDRIFQETVPQPIVNQRSSLRESLIGSNVNGGEGGSRVMYMAQIISVIYMNVLMPERFLMYEIGSKDRDVSIPRGVVWLLAEVPRSIHPAMLPNGILTMGASGLRPEVENDMAEYLNTGNFKLGMGGKLAPISKTRSGNDSYGFVGMSGTMLGGHTGMILPAIPMLHDGEYDFRMARSTTEGKAGQEREVNFEDEHDVDISDKIYNFCEQVEMKKPNRDSKMYDAGRKFPFLCDYSITMCSDVALTYRGNAAISNLLSKDVAKAHLTYVCAMIGGVASTYTSMVRGMPGEGPVSKRMRRSEHAQEKESKRM